MIGPVILILFCACVGSVVIRVSKMMVRVDFRFIFCRLGSKV